MLGASLVAGSVEPAFARGGGRMGGGGGARMGGGSGRRMGRRRRRPGLADRTVATGDTSNTPAARPAAQQRPAGATGAGATNRANSPATHSGRTTNIDNRRTNVNIDRSRDVNIQRNTAVRSGHGYGRAPYAHGGRRYYAHNRYAYHRYRGFGFGVGFYPFGAFVATMAATAIVVSAANASYYYNAGVWYLPASGGYNVVTAPVGATVATVPSSAVVVDQTNNTYYYGGTYYEKSGSSYKVVPPSRRHGRRKPARGRRGGHRRRSEVREDRRDLLPADPEGRQAACTRSSK